MQAFFLKKYFFYFFLLYDIIIIWGDIMNKTIIFDMGETLVHNVGMDFVKSLTFLYNISKNCNTTQEDFIDKSYSLLKEIFVKRSELEFKMKDYINNLIELFELSINKNLDQIEEEFAFNSCDIIKVDYVNEILQYFKNKNYQLILLSNTSFSKNVVLKMLGDLALYFEKIIVSSDTVFRKPNKNFFDLAIKYSKNNSKHIYYIGNDYYYDVYGAYNAGINPIWFNEYNCEKNNNLPDISCFEIKSYKELIDMKF